MQNNNPGQQSIQASTRGLAFALLLTCAIAQGQVGPPPAGATTATSQESLTLARARYDLAIEGELYNEAADASKLYISALLQEPDFDRKEWGMALSRLGQAQHYARLHLIRTPTRQSILKMMKKRPTSRHGS